MLYKPHHLYHSELISIMYPPPLRAIPTHVPFLLLHEYTQSTPAYNPLYIVFSLCLGCFFPRELQDSLSLVSYRGTKCHLGRKALGVHSAYNGDCHLHHSHFSLSCFSGFSKALTGHTSVIICLVVISLPTADPTRAGTLFCILLHFQYLEQRLAQSSCSINIC